MMLDFLASELRMIGMYTIAFLLGWYHINLKRLKHPFKDGWDDWGKILVNDVKSKNIIEMMYDMASTKAKKKYDTYEEGHIPKFFGMFAAAFSLPMIPVAYAGYVILSILTLNAPLEVAMILPFVINSVGVIVVSIAVVIVGMIGAGIIWVWNIISNKLSLGKIVNGIFEPIFDSITWVV